MNDRPSLRDVYRQQTKPCSMSTKHKQVAQRRSNINWWPVIEKDDIDNGGLQSQWCCFESLLLYN